MRLKTWFVAALGLGALVVLTTVSMIASSRKAQDIYAQLDALNAHHSAVEESLRRLRSDVNLSGIFVRDYLLDVARERAPEYREQIAEFRRTNMASLAELKTLINNDEQIDSLQTKLTEYWETFDPLFDWTPTEKILRSAAFLRREVVPRRDAALAIAREIEHITNENVAAQREEVARRHDAFRADLQRLIWQTVLLGLGVALLVVLRLRILEHRSEQAEQQMRELSQQLVHTQEEERKNLSRELHDHVAQVLTGLRMELGRIERLRPDVGHVVGECKRLVDDMFQTVRDLALGLRPSMLDDFGLEAALEWHVRDFMARYAITVDLTMSGDFSSLLETHRTCVYRVVQEAMTNCARHAEAKHIEIDVAALDRELRLSVADDGVGLRAAPRRKGLGLRGIDERVKELNGTMTISRRGGGGTALVVSLPLPIHEPEAELAGAVS
jgi:signal transduction histidine kinase